MYPISCNTDKRFHWIQKSDLSRTDDKQRILDIQPQSLHQRCPIFTGSKNMVEKVMQFIKDNPDQ
ncbi:hypothetical protein [Suttonella indologenes]|uniref:hypothetical protein n=1 Tax=Suttonella indologenes TaxID=13276 RepID=UPI001FE67F1F|nr:hypothetical protein [Suttonella indologenes]